VPDPRPSKRQPATGPRLRRRWSWSTGRPRRTVLCPIQPAHQEEERKLEFGAVYYSEEGLSLTRVAERAKGKEAGFEFDSRRGEGKGKRSRV
jgi:hypothetical protein